MNKAQLNYIIDMVMIIFFVIIAITGLVSFFFLPEGVRQGGYQEFLGIIKKDWNNIHNYFGIALIIIMLIHLGLHWNWILCMTENIFTKKKSR